MFFNYFGLILTKMRMHFMHKYAIWYASSERHQITV